MKPKVCQMTWEQIRRTAQRHWNRRMIEECLASKNCVKENPFLSNLSGFMPSKERELENFYSG